MSIFLGSKRGLRSERRPHVIAEVFQAKLEPSGHRSLATADIRTMAEAGSKSNVGMDWIGHRRKGTRVEFHR